MGQRESIFYSWSKLLFYIDANKTTCELTAALPTDCSISQSVKGAQLEKSAEHF